MDDMIGRSGRWSHGRQREIDHLHRPAIEDQHGHCGVPIFLPAAGGRRSGGSSLSRPVQYLLSAALSLVFLFLAFRGTDIHQLATSIADANYAWLGISFACLMLSHAVRAYRWRYLLDPIKPSIGFRNLFSGVMIGYLMNNVLPRAKIHGHTRCHDLNRSLPRRRSAPS